MKNKNLPKNNNFDGQEAEHYGNAAGTVLTAVAKLKNGEAPVTNNYNTYGETQNGLSGRTIAIMAALAAVVIVTVVILKRKK